MWQLFETTLLQLAISIAGQLVKDLELDASADWTGIVSVMKQEFKDNNLANANDDALVAAISEHPILLQRPIVVSGDRAAIGRPPESVLDIL